MASRLERNLDFVARMRKFKKSRPLTEEEVLARYPLAIPHSFDGKGGKRTVEIHCDIEGCSKIRRVRLSDLFQSRLCLEHAKLHEQEGSRRRAKASKCNRAIKRRKFKHLSKLEG